MTRHAILFLSVCLIFTWVGLTGCGEKTPPPKQPSVVKQKISSPAPTSDQKKAEDSKTGNRAPAPSKMQSSTSEDGASSPHTTDTEAGNGKAADAASDLILESRQIASTYNPKGRFDPFEPLFKEDPGTQTSTTGKDARKKRRPQTPLERVALGQLKLSAIIRAPSGNRAMVVDATGKGYVVERGTYIGLNSGRVVQIDRDRIVVEEDIEDLMGELKIQNSELKLQKPAGEL